jgi:hypothetical protein
LDISIDLFFITFNALEVMKNNAVLGERDFMKLNEEIKLSWLDLALLAGLLVAGILAFNMYVF